MKPWKGLLFVAFSLGFLGACAQATPPPSTPTLPPSETPTEAPTATPTPEPTPTVTPIFVDSETLATLQKTIVQANNPVDLAYRLGGVTEEIPSMLEPTTFQVGAKETFWVTNQRNESFQIDATLQYITDHGYFWVHDDALYEQADLEKLANTFEKKIYPRNRGFFGSEVSPGVDGDPRIYILYARRLGFNVGGYFSSADSLHPLVHEHSNAHEMFVFNADNVELAEEYTYGVLAHEFQHMIHWNLDRNETTWLNEGFAELAVLLNRYDIGGLDQLYAEDPDLQLNDWPVDDDTGPHYGASFLFVTYLMDRLGEEATQAIAVHPDNGLESIDAVLKDFAVTDPATNEPITVEDLTVDWVLANFIADEEVGDGRYYYHNYFSFPRARQTEILRTCEPEPSEYEVHQYGVDYIRVLCPGQYVMRFDGADETKLVPEDAYSGSYSFWSNKGDESDMTLTRTFDLTDQTGEITLNFWTWFDIEKDWDYLYLLASLDGETWKMLETPLGTDRNPTGNNYGWGYTGDTRGSAWVQESVDLSQYAGQEVQIRFEYITDAAVNGEGMLLDDISIPEIDYFTDFESDDGGWQADGFVRVKNVLPQSFRLALIRQEGESTTVEHLPPGVNNIVDIPLDIAEEGEAVVLVVVATTRHTRELARYTLAFTQ